MRSLIWSVVVIVLLFAGPPATSATASPKGTATSDKTLDQRIEHRLKADASLKKYDIDVSVNEHVATLTGTVPTDTARTRAEALAHVRGISRMYNPYV